MAKFEFLGHLSDRFETPMDRTVPQNITTISEVRDWLDQTLDCSIFSDPRIKAIVNDELVGNTKTIKDSDNILFYPPVGGG